jgi:predicted permease
MQDLRYALRSLRTQPLFTLAAVATMALGIGANTAIFSVVYQVLLRPLPFPEPDRLVWVWNTYGRGGEDRTAVSIPDYLDRKAGAAVIEDATLFTGRALALTGGTSPEQVRALAVTPSFFTTLGRHPAIGRSFRPEEAEPGADRSVILTDAYWRTHHGGDPRVVGGSVQLNGEAWRILGVMAPDVLLPLPDIAIIVPFAFTASQRSDSERGSEFSFMIARLRTGTTIPQLNQQMARIVEETMVRVPARAAYMRNSSFGGTAVPLHERLVGAARTPLYLVQGAVVLVLLIACVNVANLLLMRASRRGREMALRAALGAGRGRIARQLIVEGLVVSIAGTAGGVAVGLAGLKLLTALGGEQLPVTTTASLNVPVLLATAGLAIATGVLFGVAPALGVFRAALETSLRDESGRGTASRRTGTTRSTLVMIETALALMLLVGAGLLIKSLVRVLAVDPGFATSRVLTAQVALPRPRYPDAVRRRVFWQSLTARLREIPGVDAAGLTSTVPFSGMVSAGTYQLVSRPLAAAEKPPHAQLETVGGDYFRALQIPLLQGRLFDDRDGPDEERAVIVDRFLARRQFPDRSPVGELLSFGGTRTYRIIGVVGTINAADLSKPVPEERIYESSTQDVNSAMGLVIRTKADAPALVSELRKAVESIDPEQPIADVRTMDEWIGRSLQPRRAPTRLLAAFGGVSLLLAAVGIYGVLAFAVNQRAREFGIRRALGADRASILTLVFTQGLRPTLAGIGVGLAGAAASARYLESMLFGVAGHDPTVLAGATVLLLVVAGAACYLPARAATRADPMAALREE